MNKLYVNTKCYSDEISHITISSGKSNGWIGNIAITDLEGNNVSFICAEGCVKTTGYVDNGIIVSNGINLGNTNLGVNDVRDYEPLAHIENLCLLGNICTLKPQWNKFEGVKCDPKTVKTCSTQDNISNHACRKSCDKDDSVCCDNVLWKSEVNGHCSKASSCKISPSFNKTSIVYQKNERIGK